MKSNYYQEWQDYINDHKDMIIPEFESFISPTLQKYEDLIFDFYINIVW